ncbi:MAG: hypothetical protein ND866_14640 [Pyrinomonadaceae bacterium]|nr:hypothetical protein [Pyrinomonadaceae bacterium]
MFCPKCNQQQASDDMGFCSRCGFPLSVVADLLAHNGALAKVSEEDRLSARQKGVRAGVCLIFASLVIGFVMALLSVFVIGKPELFIPMTSGVFFLSGILRIAYACMFEPDIRLEEPSSRPIQVRAPESGYALPPAQNISAIGTQVVNTAEMLTRPSVTEHTTKLLDQD